MRICTVIAAAAALAALVTVPAGAGAAGLARLWVTEDVLEVPESVCWDQAREIMYVSNISGKPLEKDGRGFISRIDIEGGIRKLHWVSGLNAPKGMGVFEGSLYVTDIDEVVEIDIAGDSIRARYPAAGAVFLNDIAVDADGDVYVSDYSSDNGVIYRLRGGEMEVWLEHELIERPNGLCIDDGRLVVGSSGTGTLVSVDLEDKSVEETIVIGTSIDGVEITDGGNFVVSNWSGRTVLAEPDGSITILLDTTAEGINSADLEYVPGRGIVLIPTFGDNRVLAARLTE